MISIIIPFYNKSKTINKTLSSIDLSLNRFNKGHVSYELIIVNDGSNQEETLTLNKIIKKFPSLKIDLYEKKNGGVSSARNYGILKASQKFIYFLDADDIVDIDFFSKLQKNCISLHSTHIFSLKINNKIIKLHPVDFSSSLINPATENTFITLLQRRVIHLTNFVFIKNNLIPFNENIHIGEDILFIYENVIDKNLLICNDFLATYCYDGKYHATNENGMELILEKLTMIQNIEYLDNVINERNFLTTKLTGLKMPYRKKGIGFIIKVIGLFKSRLLYTTIQKIRFFIP